jgi:hypothetical protein
MKALGTRLSEDTNSGKKKSKWIDKYITIAIVKSRLKYDH